jgi:GDP-fucose transporter C1
MAIVFMLPFVLLSGEYTMIRQTVDFFDAWSFWAIMIVTAVTGFLINISVFLQIKYTTPLTNTISGTAKVNHTLYYSMI